MEEQNAIINEFFDVIEANDVKETFQINAQDMSLTLLMFHVRIVHHQRILMGKSGLVDKTYRDEFDEIDTHICIVKLSRTVFQNPCLVLFVV